MSKKATTIVAAKFECILLAQSFEVLWAYYSQSGGNLYNRECRKAAEDFIDSYKSLSKLIPNLKKAILSKIGDGTDINNIIKRLDHWSQDYCSQYPYESAFKSRFMLYFFLTSVKTELLNKLNIKRYPHMLFSSEEDDFSSRIIRWRAHMPRAALLSDPDKIFTETSTSPTIAVVGDIRKSQDLMTYSPNSKHYAERIISFITKIREITEENAGFFDKFTGDGFIVYFNESICKFSGKDYIESFLKFIREISNFSNPLFEDWTLDIRKRPPSEIGLAIGADFGFISFEDIQDHVIAVGDTIVWASRMAAIAKSRQIVVNNLLFAKLASKEGLDFEKIEAITKAGEGFVAHSLVFR